MRLFAVLLAWLLSGELHAQAPARAGFLGQGSAAAMARPLEAMREELRRLGYVEGKNLLITYRWGNGKIEALPALARELVEAKPALVIVWGTGAAFALKRATKTIPIVMVNVGDPLDTGLIDSLARPGGNITGFSNLGGDVAAKQIELLAEVVPKLTRLAVLRNPANVSLGSQLRGAEAAARTQGLQLRVFDVQGAADFETAFLAINAWKPQALMVLAEPLFVSEADKLAALALRHRLPTISARAETAEAGLLLAYGGSTEEQFRGGAAYAARVLRGEKPADLPVQQSSQFVLIVNQKTARQLGVTMPGPVLLRAEKVIE